MQAEQKFCFFIGLLRFPLKMSLIQSRKSISHPEPFFKHYSQHLFQWHGNIQRERIFRLFESLDPDPHRPGAGIGLAIVKKIVEKNGGSVGVTSQLGQGTTFRFSVPKLPPARRDARS